MAPNTVQARASADGAKHRTHICGTDVANMVQSKKQNMVAEPGETLGADRGVAPSAKKVSNGWLPHSADSFSYTTRGGVRGRRLAAINLAHNLVDTMVHTMVPNILRCKT